MALRGLSSPVSSQAGNRFGVVGMVIAIATTLAQPNVVSYPLIIAGIVIGGAIGAFTSTGTIVAFAKLQGLVTGAPLVFKAQHSLNAAQGIAIVGLIVWLLLAQNPIAFMLLVAVSLLLGFLLILPIGGADMPVVVSMLNSYSGWAACGIGFTLSNNLLIVTGALVGSSGAILSYIMCKGMNRSIFNVILGGFGTDSGTRAQ